MFARALLVMVFLKLKLVSPVSLLIVKSVHTLMIQDVKNALKGQP